MRRLVAGVLCSSGLLTGCSSAPVEVAVAPAGTTPACAAVAWPGQVAGQDRTTTRPEDPSTAAWASGRAPAIIARCGVSVPGPTRQECLAVDDIDWIAERLDDGMRFTTYGRDPALEVLVPDRYAPEPLVLSALRGAAIAGAPTGHRCS